MKLRAVFCCMIHFTFEMVYSNINKVKVCGFFFFLISKTVPFNYVMMQGHLHYTRRPVRCQQKVQGCFYARFRLLL